MPTRTVDLPEELDAFVRSEIERGHFGSISEVISAGLRTLERDEHDEEAKLTALRLAIDDGIASGIFHGDAFASVRKEFGLPPRV